jgi:hypothetical protein
VREVVAQVIVGTADDPCFSPGSDGDRSRRHFWSAKFCSGVNRVFNESDPEATVGIPSEEAANLVIRWGSGGNFPGQEAGSSVSPPMNAPMGASGWR